MTFAGMERPRELFPVRAMCETLGVITYIETGERWLYMVAVLDPYSRKIVGSRTADHIRGEPVDTALSMALERRKPGAGLMHHSDRGVQYVCNRYQQRLEQEGLISSMNRTENYYDNAAMESF